MLNAYESSTRTFDRRIQTIVKGGQSKHKSRKSWIFFALYERVWMIVCVAIVTAIDRLYIGGEQICRHV